MFILYELYFLMRNFNNPETVSEYDQFWWNSFYER